MVFTGRILCQHSAFLLSTLPRPRSSVLVTSTTPSRPRQPQARAVSERLPAATPHPHGSGASPAAQPKRGRGEGSCHVFLRSCSSCQAATDNTPVNRYLSGRCPAVEMRKTHASKAPATPCAWTGDAALGLWGRLQRAAHVGPAAVCVCVFSVVWARRKRGMFWHETGRRRGGHSCSFRV